MRECTYRGSTKFRGLFLGGLHDRGYSMLESTFGCHGYTLQYIYIYTHTYTHMKICMLIRGWCNAVRVQLQAWEEQAILLTLVHPTPLTELPTSPIRRGLLGTEAPKPALHILGHYKFGGAGGLSK